MSMNIYLIFTHPIKSVLALFHLTQLSSIFCVTDTVNPFSVLLNQSNSKDEMYIWIWYMYIVVMSCSSIFNNCLCNWGLAWFIMYHHLCRKVVPKLMFKWPTERLHEKPIGISSVLPQHAYERVIITVYLCKHSSVPVLWCGYMPHTCALPGHTACNGDVGLWQGGGKFVILRVVMFLLNLLKKANMPFSMIVSFSSSVESQGTALSWW